MGLMRSWVESANDADCPFPLNNLPCGVFSLGAEEPVCGVAIGVYVLDAAGLEHAGILALDGGPLLDVPFWNEVMGAGPEVWAALRARLIELREREKEEQMADIKGEMKKIEWGSQIRSYVFQPYTMVKDHRTGYESGNITDVMDGNLDGFITAYLKMQ